MHIMIQEMGDDKVAKCILRLNARPDYEPPFSVLDGLLSDNERRHWIGEQDAEGNIVGTGEELGQMATEVKIAFPVSHDTFPGADNRAGVCVPAG